METDESGNVSQLLAYMPYGSVQMSESDSDGTVPGENYDTPYKFTGKELDEETDLYYYGARYYDHDSARFMSADPAALYAPGHFLMDPQQLNLYSYVRNNPVKYTDPTGEAIETAVDLGFTMYDTGRTIKNLYETTTSGWAALYYQYVSGDTHKASEAANSYKKNLQELGGSLTDLGIDVAATAIPFVPAAVSKVDDAGKFIAKASDGFQLKGNYGTEYAKKMINSYEWLKSQGIQATEHALNSVQELKKRIGITGEDIVNLHHNGDVYYDTVEKNYNRFIEGGKARMVLSNDTGKVVTVVEVKKGALASERFIKQ